MPDFRPQSAPIDRRIKTHVYLRLCLTTGSQSRGSLHAGRSQKAVGDLQWSADIFGDSMQDSGFFIFASAPTKSPLPLVLS